MSWRGIADSLTAARAVAALAVGWAAYEAALLPLALLLAGCWWSDFADGRLAHRSGQPGRLASWDLPVDTTVGASLVTGLLLGGHLPPWWGIPAAGFGVIYVATRSPTWSMLLQAIGYGAALWLLKASGPGLVVSLGTIGAIAVLARSRLVGWVLPTFFEGLVGRGGGGHPDGDSVDADP